MKSSSVSVKMACIVCGAGDAFDNIDGRLEDYFDPYDPNYFDYDYVMWEEPRFQNVPSLDMHRSVTKRLFCFLNCIPHSTMKMVKESLLRPFRECSSLQFLQVKKSFILDHHLILQSHILKVEIDFI